MHSRVTRPLQPLHAPPNSLQPQRCVRVTKGRLPGHLCGLLWDTEHAWPNYSAGNSSLLGDGKMHFSPPEAARGNFWLFAPFWGEFGPFLTFNNVNNSKHWPTLNNVKEFCQCYANIQTQTQRSAALVAQQAALCLPCLPAACRLPGRHRASQGATPSELWRMSTLTTGT